MADVSNVASIQWMTRRLMQAPGILTYTLRCAGEPRCYPGTSFCVRFRTAVNGELPPGMQLLCPGHRAVVRSWRSKNSRCAVREGLPAKRCAGRSEARALSEEPGCAHPRDTSYGFPLWK